VLLFFYFLQQHAKKRGKDASLKAEAELTSEDKKRIRRASKSANKVKKLQEKNELVVALNTQPKSAAEEASIAKKRRIEDEKALDKQLQGDSRVQLSAVGNKKSKQSSGDGKDNNRSFSKSASFFSRLQQDTADQIKAKSSGSSKSSQIASKNPFASMTSHSVKL
jgi:hypothetical protein